MGFEFFLIIGDEVWMGGEAVFFGAGGFDEFFAVLLFQATLQLGAEVAVGLMGHDVIDEALGHEVRGIDPASLSFLQLYHKAHQ